MGVPGLVDIQSGVTRFLPNLPTNWRDIEAGSILGDKIGAPVRLLNDVRTATLGELTYGHGAKFGTMAFFSLGTGIGGGFVMNGEIHHGASDAAGEFGHMTIDSTGRKCKCGNYGCLEAYASGPNIAARAVEGIEAGVESLLVELVDGELDRITAATVYEGVVRDDPYAHEVMKETAKFLGVGVANLINALNPDAVVIAGGVTRAGEHLFAPLRKEVRRRAFRSAVDACRIVPAALPETAGVIGAAGIFKNQTYGSV